LIHDKDFGFKNASHHSGRLTVSDADTIPEEGGFPKTDLAQALAADGVQYSVSLSVFST
jgi:hypothetical protein